MILVDTSIIVAWMDAAHKHHRECWAAIRHWSGRDQLAISSVTYAELAAGARTQESVNEALAGFARIDLDFESAWRAGHAFRQHRPGKTDLPVLPDFFIRAQAAMLNPKSEIKMADLPQSVGHKRIEKILPDHFGYGCDFFDSFLLQHLATSRPF